MTGVQPDRATRLLGQWADYLLDKSLVLPGERRAGQPLLGKRAPWYCHGHTPSRLDVPPHL